MPFTWYETIITSFWPSGKC